MIYPLLAQLWAAIKTDSTVREVVAGVIFGVGQVVASGIRQRGRDHLKTEVRQLRIEMTALMGELRSHVKESSDKHASYRDLPALP
jgi:hypothetical protein